MDDDKYPEDTDEIVELFKNVFDTMDDEYRASHIQAFIDQWKTRGESPKDTNWYKNKFS